MTETETETSKLILIPVNPVGIIGYGAYVPRYRLPGSEVARIWVGGSRPGPVKEKAVPGLDEDVVTMSIEAARNALLRAEINLAELRAIWVGSESHPYSVKPTSTIVAEAIGAVPSIQAADWEFACKAGTEAMVAAIAMVGAKMGRYAMAIGMDTAQSRPGDDLEYTAAAGGAAFVLGPAEEALAIIEGSYSYVTDTPDFWRRADVRYPSHAERFTGDPAYFNHIISASRVLLDGMNRKPADYQYCVFHQPNTKFPQRAAQLLGFTPEQNTTGLLSPMIGNTYAGAAIIGLTAILDVAKPGDRILMTSYGSGAGSDAFSLLVTDKLAARQDKAVKTLEYIARRTEVDYGTYVRYRRLFAE